MLSLESPLGGCNREVILSVNDSFGDFLVGWFKQVTSLHSDLMGQVSLYC